VCCRAAAVRLVRSALHTLLFVALPGLCASALCWQGTPNVVRGQWCSHSAAAIWRPVKLSHVACVSTATVSIVSGAKANQPVQAITVVVHPRRALEHSRAIGWPLSICSW
jgi:hypothetical protein